MLGIRRKIVFILIFLLTLLTIFYIKVNTKENINKLDPVDNIEKVEENIDSNYLVENSEHFEIYYTIDDKIYAKHILKILEKNYDKIINDLKPSQLPIIKVRLYPTQKDFFQSIQEYNRKDWVVGITWGKDEIRMLSPNNKETSHSYNEIVKTAIHEFTHIVCIHLNSYASQQRWLWEGIALYEAGQTRNLEKLRINNNNLPSLFELNTNIDYLYNLSYSLIEYIVNNWGMEKVRELIVENGDIEKVLHISKEEFERDWHNYLIKIMK